MFHEGPNVLWFVLARICYVLQYQTCGSCKKNIVTKQNEFQSNENELFSKTFFFFFFGIFGSFVAESEVGFLFQID